MISSIVLKNFKCFIHQEIHLAECTLLTGLNNSGKSSVFQGLRMLSKWRRNIDPVLDGHGSLNECRNKKSSSIELSCNFKTEKSTSLIIEFSDAGKPLIRQIDLESGMMPALSYLSADRWGPRVSLPLYTATDDLSHVGEYGEYVLDYLNRHENDIVPELLRHPNSEGETLQYNVRAWLGEISPNVIFKHASEVMRDSSFATIDGFRPTNTGFGLSYALPIIVAVLGAASSSSAFKEENEKSTLNSSRPLVLIENPEAHLHPKGQLKMGMLIAKAAKAGIQIIVESHSDHIFNGLRIAVHQKTLRRDQLKIHYFSRSSEGIANIITPKIDENGRIDKWPEGFFDEWDKALDKLLLPAEGACGSDLQ